CRSTSDVLLLVGEALRAPVPGSAVSVSAHLRQRGALLVILDDADAPGARAAIEQLGALAPEVRWLALAPTIPDDGAAAPTINLPPTPTPAVTSELEEAASVLMMLPGGLPAVVSVPPHLAHPTPPGRVALRRSVARALRQSSRLEPSRAAEALLPTFAHVLSLAEGAPLQPGVRAADLLAVRWMGEVLSDSATAARATAAAGRLLVIWGQPGAARSLLGSGLRRDTRAAPESRARLLWAEAEALLASGNLTGARLRHAEAERLLGEGRDLDLMALMARRRGDALAVRGQVSDAARDYQQARALTRQLRDTEGSAATLRATADLAVGRGELMSAEALYDQAESSHAPPIEAANRRIGRAGLAIAAGALDRAGALLMVEPAVDLPVLQANLARRRADLALRKRRYGEARRQATDALSCYARAGERVAMGRTTRLLGDIDAAAGRLADAAAHYMRAVPLQIEVGDMEGLRRTLRHAVALEDSADEPDTGAALRDFLSDLEASLPAP
ncbi:MAG: tetratricopeptide (TPR) repeat protein, partial [Myxococcota bacterium]